jgi:hypothetical protein
LWILNSVSLVICLHTMPRNLLYICSFSSDSLL